MKRMMLGLLPLIVIGCGKIDRNVSLEQETDGEANRLAVGQVGTGSGRNDMRDESRHLNNRNEDIARLCASIDEIYEKVEGRIVAYNAELERREVELTALNGARTDLEANIGNYEREHDHYSSLRSKKEGEIEVIKKLGINRVGSVKDNVIAEKKRYRALRRVQIAVWKRAVRDVKKSKFVSPAYENAVEERDNAYAKSKQFEASLNYLTMVEKANYTFNAAQEVNRLPALNDESEAATRAITNNGFYLAPLRTSLQTVLREIAALPTVDGLKPVELPSQCE